MDFTISQHPSSSRPVTAAPAPTPAPRPASQSVDLLVTATQRRTTGHAAQPCPAAPTPGRVTVAPTPSVPGAPPTVMAPSPAIFTYLLGRAASFDEARHVVEGMHRAGVRGDYLFYRGYIAKAANWAQALEAKETMHRAGLCGNSYTTHLLMGLAPNFSAAWSLLTDLRRKGVLRDPYTYGPLLDKATDFASAKQVLRAMLGDWIRLNTHLAARFVARAQSAEERREAVALLGHYRPGATWQRVEIGAAETNVDALAVYEARNTRGPFEEGDAFRAICGRLGLTFLDEGDGTPSV
jgi:hypothetical protein